MAVLGKIRSKGALLVSIIGLGLFAFIAEEAFRSCETTRNDQRQQIGQILGEKVNYQDFQKLIDEYTDVIKMTQGRDNLSEEELNSVRDQVWNTFIQTKLLEADAKKLGLAVTDDEIRDILNEGTNQLLLQSPFVNQQTGRFDANMLKQFLAEYKKGAANSQMQEQYGKIYNYWNFIEKTLRQQTLAQKYQALLASTFLTNSVETKQVAAEENEEADVQLVAFSYDDPSLSKVEPTEADLKAKYNEMKPRFKQYEETRDIKYVSVQMKATAKDKAALLKTTQDCVNEMAAAEDPTEAVRKANSDIPYIGVPVLKSAYPSDIAALLDSVAVGSTSAVKENTQDNTYNAIRLISRQELPDSIEFQAIQVGGETPDEAHKRADSIYNALAADATQWDAIAKKYNQVGAKTWMTTQQYQNAPSIDKDTKAYLNALNTMSVGELRNITATSGNIIIKVTDRKAFQTKYVAAVVKTFINFSKDTRTNEYNKFSAYVSGCNSLEDLEANAKKNGYTVQENKDIRSAQHYVGGIRGTHEALKWAFEAKEGAISPLYECGDNDNLLVCVVTKVHPKGYRGLDDEQVKEIVKAEAANDKKAEQIMKSLANVKNIAAAKKVKGAKATDVAQATFASPVFVQATGAAEPALSGAIAATKQGQYCARPVKGYRGVYVFQVTKKAKRAAKPDAKEIAQRLVQQKMQAAGNFMQDLYLKAGIEDNRYIFF